MAWGSVGGVRFELLADPIWYTEDVRSTRWGLVGGIASAAAIGGLGLPWYSGVESGGRFSVTAWGASNEFPAFVVFVAAFALASWRQVWLGSLSCVPTTRCRCCCSWPRAASASIESGRRHRARRPRTLASVCS